MLSNVLYSKRFFPYSVSNVLAGLDEDGEGWVYSYDPVGCVEKLKNSSGGAGVAIIQPLLDNQVSNLFRPFRTATVVWLNDSLVCFYFRVQTRFGILVKIYIRWANQVLG